MKIITAAVVAVSVSYIWTDATIPAFAQAKLTPGTAARLIEPQGLADLNRLRDGIADSDPVVRAVTARIAGLLNRTELSGGLLEVLAGEQDVTAAREQVRLDLPARGHVARDQGRCDAARRRRPFGIRRVAGENSSRSVRRDTPRYAARCL
jgi:hypothetical protein